MNYEDPESFCICCQQPYPEDEHFYSVCEDNMKLGDMGPGYPMLFEFMKRVGYLLLILTCTYFIPVMYMIFTIYSETDPDSLVDRGICPADSTAGAKAARKRKPSIMGIIGVMSTGAFVKPGMLAKSTVRFQWFDDSRQSFMYISAILVFLGVIISLIYLVCMRWKMAKIALDLDKDVYTPSDFCVMGMEMAFDDYSAEGIEERVKDVFMNKYSAKVEYVNPCFKIANIYKLNEKYNSLQKLKSLIELYCADNDIDEQGTKDFDGTDYS